MSTEVEVCSKSGFAESAATVN